jgi:orotate phosphoribosyltransferase
LNSRTDAVIEMFRRTGAYLEGHFQLTSGLHSAQYLQCALVLQFPAAAEKLGSMLAAEIRSVVPDKITLVASPAMGGLLIGHEVARALHTRFIFTERDPNTRQMLLRRGLAPGPSDTAVVVEDVITTGGSTAEVVNLLRAAGTKVVAAGSIIDRSNGRANVGHNLARVSLAALQVAAHYPAQCPLCQSGIPVTKPGSRPD